MRDDFHGLYTSIQTIFKYVLGLINLHFCMGKTGKYPPLFFLLFTSGAIHKCGYTQKISTNNTSLRSYTAAVSLSVASSLTSSTSLSNFIFIAKVETELNF